MLELIVNTNRHTSFDCKFVFFKIWPLLILNHLTCCPKNGATWLPGLCILGRRFCLVLVYWATWPSGSCTHRTTWPPSPPFPGHVTVCSTCSWTRDRLIHVDWDTWPPYPRLRATWPSFPHVLGHLVAWFTYIWPQGLRNVYFFSFGPHNSLIDIHWVM
jgi:hypothetical protein